MKALGIVLIVLGSMAGCLGLMTVPAMMLVARMQPPPGAVPATAPATGPTTQPAAAAAAAPIAQVSDVVAGALMYLLIAVLLASAGAGSFRVRRWSRPVTLILTGSWVVMGLIGMISMALVIPAMRRAVASAGGANPAAGPGAGAMAAGSLIVGLLFVVLFGVLLPGGLFLFFRRRAVQQTLDYFAPQRAWTDGCPTPVLAVSFWLLVGALAMLASAAKGVFPAFGTLLTGPTAIALFVVGAVLLLVVSVATYRVSPTAWWAALLLVLVGTASTVITNVRVDPLEQMRLSGVPDEQLQMMRDMGFARSGAAMATIAAVYGAAALAYLLWARKYFAQRDSGITLPSAGETP
jgi:hypothetical protein